MADKQTGRGWEWTDEEREACKVWRQRLAKLHDKVSSLVRDSKEHLPQFSAAAERAAQPFLRQAAELIALDVRRSGRKWQPIPYSAVPDKVKRAAELYEEYRACFLSRDDFQQALKDYNRGVCTHNRVVQRANRDLVEQVVERNLALLEELRTSRQTLEACFRTVWDGLTEISIVAVHYHHSNTLPESELAALHRWMAMQYLDIAASMDCQIREYIVGRIQKGDDPLVLLPDVYLRLTEYDLNHYNQMLRNTPYFLAMVKPADATSATFAVMMNTIHHRLERQLSEYPDKLPSEFELLLFGQEGRFLSTG